MSEATSPWSNLLDWRTLLKWGFAIAVEYSVLSLIEDSPSSVKLATIVISILALLVLQFEARLPRRVFVSSLIMLALIPIVITVYGRAHVSSRSRVYFLTNLSDSQLANTTLIIANTLRDAADSFHDGFELNKLFVRNETIGINDKQQQVAIWHRYLQRNLDTYQRMQHEWEDVYRPNVVSLHNELRRRLGNKVCNATPAPSYEHVTKTTDLEEIAGDLECLAKSLPPQ